MTEPRPPDGVLLMTYGSPATLDDVARYLTAVRGGRPPEADLVAEFRRRYGLIGGSPLIPITIAQAEALEQELAPTAVVRAGMRFSEPSIESALRELTERGIERVVGIVLSPQFSELLMSGYERAVEAARSAIGQVAPHVDIAGSWYDEPAFIEAMAGRVRAALEEFPARERGEVPVLMTAHSLPRRVAEREPRYLDQLRATAESIARSAGLGDDRWSFCWQSAGHEPGEWMTPDFADLMPELRRRGHTSVLVAPIQFLADHLEILYDVDIGAREQAESVGLEFRRIGSLNVDPLLIRAFAGVARRRVDGRTGAGAARQRQI